MSISLGNSPRSGAPALQQEIEAFEKIKNSLLTTDYGRHAVFHKDQFAGCWDTVNDAVQYAHEKFGDVPFLVKQVLTTEPEVKIRIVYSDPALLGALPEVP